MARFIIRTAASPAALLDDVARRVATEHRSPDFAVIVSRASLARDLRAATGDHLARTNAQTVGGSGWLGPRVLLVEKLLAHYALGLEHAAVLKPIQARQIITALMRDMHAQSDGAAFAGQIVGDRVSEATLRSLLKLFGELEPWNYEPTALESKLRDGAGGAGLSLYAQRVIDLYGRYRAHLAAKRVLGPLGQATEAAKRAATVRPPDGLTRFVFLGFDSYSQADVGVKLLQGLVGNASAVDEVTLALVAPDDVIGSSWTTHGSASLLELEQSLGGVRETVPTLDWLTARHTDARGQVATDLVALSRDPFGYREAKAPVTGAVRAIRVPDTQFEIEWIAADIRRRLLASDVETKAGTGPHALRPHDIAIIARNMSERAQDFAQALARLGLPVVASREMPIAEIPAVDALLTLFRLPADGWRTADVVAAAESPYLGLGLNPTLLNRLGTVGTMPESAEAWRARILAFAASEREAGEAATDLFHGADDLPTDAEAAAREMAARFDGFVALLARTVGTEMARTPNAWYEALVRVTNHVANERRIYEIGGGVDGSVRGEYVRAEIDGVNALLLTAADWASGRALADLADTPLTLREWVTELTAIAESMTIRVSSFDKEAVQLVDPVQAAMRSWDVVYVVGLTDGTFPARTKSDEHSLTDAERSLLNLATRPTRAARERLLFHFAVAAARRALILVTPSADDHGKALVTSPFVTYLALRLDGIAFEHVTARALIPRTADAMQTVQDVDLVMADRYRALAGRVTTKATLTRAIKADPDLRAWLSTPAARRTVAAWAVERLRDDLETLLTAAPAAVRTHPYRAYVGQFDPEDVPARLRDERTAFTPGDLSAYHTCHFKFLATRLFGLTHGPEREEDQDEAAAFGALQHRILERLYRSLERDGHLPPRTAADVTEALRRLVPIAQTAVEQYTASAHRQLWATDLEFVLDVLRQFVRRDLTSQLAAATNPLSPHLRVRPVYFEERLGTDQRPIDLDVDGVRFRLRGTVDRVELLDDPRLPAAYQGTMLVSTYRSGRSAFAPRLKAYLKGEILGPPLYALMLERHMAQLAAEGTAPAGARVFGFRDLKTSQGADPDLVGVRTVEVDVDEGLLLSKVEPPRGMAPFEKGNPLPAITTAAVEAAARAVAGMRQGDFMPQPGRNCFGCPLKAVCRSATMARPDARRQRGHMPVAVTAEAFRAAQEDRVE